jgi:SAM-dependent methyltransferase
MSRIMSAVTPVRPGIEVLLELAPPRARDVVDVGCGTGGLVRALATRGARVVGVEVSAEALRRARSAPAVAGERYVEGGAEALPLPDASADLVVFHHSLHHVPADALDAALAEAARVARPGGAVYVQEPLAEGAFFALVRLVDDESRVRALAQAAVRRAGRSGLELMREVRFDAPVSLAGFHAFHDTVVLADPRRRAAFAAAEEELRARFAAAAEPDGEGVRFLQPTVAQLLRRAA